MGRIDLHAPVVLVQWVGAMAIGELAGVDHRGASLVNGGNFLDEWQCLRPYLANKNTGRGAL